MVRNGTIHLEAPPVMAARQTADLAVADAATVSGRGSESSIVDDYEMNVLSLATA